MISYIAVARVLLLDYAFCLYTLSARCHLLSVRLWAPIFTYPVLVSSNTYNHDF